MRDRAGEAAEGARCLQNEKPSPIAAPLSSCSRRPFPATTHLLAEWRGRRGSEWRRLRRAAKLRLRLAKACERERESRDRLCVECARSLSALPTHTQHGAPRDHAHQIRKRAAVQTSWGCCCCVSLRSFELSLSSGDACARARSLSVLALQRPTPTPDAFDATRRVSRLCDGFGSGALLIKARCFFVFSPQKLGKKCCAHFAPPYEP